MPNHGKISNCMKYAFTNCDHVYVTNFISLDAQLKTVFNDIMLISKYIDIHVNASLLLLPIIGLIDKDNERHQMVCVYFKNPCNLHHF